MEAVIKKAIEGGYDLPKCLPETAWKHLCNVNMFVLDPLFLQALGKSFGWRYQDSLDREGRLNGEWIEQWENFIHHLASGKDIDSFFTNLLK